MAHVRQTANLGHDRRRVRSNVHGNHTVQFSIRITEAESEQLHTAAGSMGLSTYVRDLILSADMRSSSADTLLAMWQVNDVLMDIHESVLVLREHTSEGGRVSNDHVLRVMAAIADRLDQVVPALLDAGLRR